MKLGKKVCLIPVFSALVFAYGSVESAIEVINLGTIKIGNSPSHFLVKKCFVGKSPNEVLLYRGVGTTDEGREFEVSADGNEGWVEVHVGNDSGDPETFYSTSIKNSQIKVADNQVTIRGKLNMVSSDRQSIPFELVASCE